MFKISAYIFTAFPMLAFVYAPNLQTIIALLLIAFYVSPLLLYAEVKPSEYDKISRNTFIFAFVIHITVGILNIVLIANQSDQSATQLLSLDGIQIIALTSTALRYGGTGELASGSPILISINLFLIFLIGKHTRSKLILVSIICFAPFVAYSILTTAKFPTYLGIAFYLTGRVGAPQKEARRIGHLLKPAIYLFALGTLVLGVSALNRGHEYDMNDFLLTIGNYLFAQYYAFGTWIIDMGGFASCCKFGTSSFLGPLDFFGMVVRPDGIYDVYIDLYGQKSNIYTVWRFLIEDFSIAGPFIFNTIIVATCWVAVKHRIYFPQMITRNFLFLSAMLSFSTGLFIYNSVFLAFAIICAYDGYIVLKHRNTLKSKRFSS